MPKINIIYELEQNYLNDKISDYKQNQIYDKEKNIKVSDKIFDLMLAEGLIRKTTDGYVFVGKYEDFHKPKDRHRINK